MAEKSVTVDFVTRDEYYNAPAGFNELGHPLEARLEIDREKTAGEEPYKLTTNAAGTKRGQDVWLKYYSNSDETIVVRTTNGTAVLVSENIVSGEKTETIIFENEAEADLSGIPTDGNVEMEWIGRVLENGSGGDESAALCEGETTSSGPNVTYDGQKINVPKNVTGVLKVTYTETYAEIRSNAAEAGTVVVVVCQGRLATSAQYEVEEYGTGVSVEIDPSDECCSEGNAISGPDSVSIGIGGSKAVPIYGGCPPFSWTITGTGLSVLHGTTEEARFNTISASLEACGDGALTVTDTCGESVEILVQTDAGCCSGEGYIPIKWADGNPSGVCVGAGANALSVEGGVGPYSWQVVEGSGFASFNESETEDGLNVLNVTDPGDPDTARVRVDDSCGEIITLEVAVGMEWSEDNPETIDREDEIAISIEGGAGPFRWTVSGTGYTLGAEETDERVNLLIADSSACGTAAITVTDECGETVVGSVRGTEGHWADDVCHVYMQPCMAGYFTDVVYEMGFGLEVQFRCCQYYTDPYPKSGVFNCNVGDIDFTLPWSVDEYCPAGYNNGMRSITVDAWIC